MIICVFVLFVCVFFPLSIFFFFLLFLSVFVVVFVVIIFVESIYQSMFAFVFDFRCLYCLWLFDMFFCVFFFFVFFCFFIVVLLCHHSDLCYVACCGIILFPHCVCFVVTSILSMCLFLFCLYLGVDSFQVLVLVFVHLLFLEVCLVTFLFVIHYSVLWDAK